MNFCWNNVTKLSMLEASCKLAHKFCFKNVIVSSKLSCSYLKVRFKSYRILYYGSDEFSLQCIKKLQNNMKDKIKKQVIKQLEVVCLPAGNVKSKLMYKYAKSQSFNVHMWPYLPPPNMYDIGVIVSFGKLIPESVIKSFQFGMINVHPSLIPKFRGAAPISRAIEAGLKTTGVSILQVSPRKFDRGLILDQSDEIPIESNITTQELSTQLADIGGDMCLQVLANLSSKLESSFPQNEPDACYAPKITLEDTYIDWTTMTSAEVWNKFRAFGFQKQFRLRCAYHNGTSLDLIKLAEIELINKADLNLPAEFGPGDVWFSKTMKKLIIGCKSGCIVCSNLYVSDKRRQTAVDFYNGFMQTRLKRGEKILFQNT